MINSERRQIQKWDDYVKNLVDAIPVPTESITVKSARIARLLGDFEAFCKYYFPKYATSDFADFHLEFAKEIVENDKIYSVRAWAREHGKSVTAGLFLPIFLMFNKKMYNMLLVSNSYDNAEDLLMPIMLNLESNARIIADFGVQKGFRNWETGKFITTSGCSFRALGAGQSPRGKRNEEKRPDFVLVDDIDTDEEGRNAERVKQKWKWLNEALFYAMGTLGVRRFVVVGNIIHKNSIVVRASKKADSFRTINALDKDGKPSWASRYVLADIQYLINKTSYIASQKELFNNPIDEGTVFKAMTYGKIPPLNQFAHLVVYTDPSFKEAKSNDYKATVLLGEKAGKYYIIKAFVEQTGTGKMIDWHYDIQSFVNEQAVIYWFIEANFAQDVFLAKFQESGIDRGYIPIQGDDRKKPDKFSRIEATLEPYNRQGRLICNEDEKNNPHMMRLEDQFLALAPNSSSHDDAPDAVEGGVYILNTKLRELMPIDIIETQKSKNRF